LDRHHVYQAPLKFFQVMVFRSKQHPAFCAVEKISQPIALLLEMESWKSLHPLHLVCQFARCRYMLYPIGFLKKKDSCRVIRKTPPAAQVVEFEG